MREGDVRGGGPSFHPSGKVVIISIAIDDAGDGAGARSREHVDASPRTFAAPTVFTPRVAPRGRRSVRRGVLGAMARRGARAAGARGGAPRDTGVVIAPTGSRDLGTRGPDARASSRRGRPGRRLARPRRRPTTRARAARPPRPRRPPRPPPRPPPPPPRPFPPFPSRAGPGTPTPTYMTRPSIGSGAGSSRASRRSSATTPPASRGTTTRRWRGASGW